MPTPNYWRTRWWKSGWWKPGWWFGSEKKPSQPATSTDILGRKIHLRARTPTIAPFRPSTVTAKRESTIILSPRSQPIRLTARTPAVTAGAR